MNIVEQNWDQILNKMKLEYCSSNISYNTWIAPLTVYEIRDNTVYILVKLRASLEHIEEKYLLPFKVCIAEVTGIEYEVAFVTDNQTTIQEKRENTVKRSRSQNNFETGFFLYVSALAAYFRLQQIDKLHVNPVILS